MITVLASITVEPTRKEEFLSIFKANIPAVLAERGCIEYLPMIDFTSNIPIQDQSANTITIVEKWQSIEALYAHLEAPHMIEYKDKVADMVTDLSLKILQNA